MGAIESVQLASLPRSVVVCNVIDCGLQPAVMNRLCWSGKPANKGLDNKGFKMEAWDTIAQLAQEADWSFR